MYVCACICIYVCTYVHTWVCLCVCTSKETIRVCSWRHRWGCQNMWLIPWFCRALGRISFMFLWPHTAFFLLGFCHMFLGLSLLWPLGPTRIPALSLIPPWCSPLVCSGWDVFHHPGSRISSMAGHFLPLLSGFIFCSSTLCPCLLGFVRCSRDTVTTDTLSQN